MNQFVVAEKNAIIYRNTKAGYTIISTGIVHYIASMDCSVGPRNETVSKIHVVAGFCVFAFSENLSS